MKKALFILPLLFASLQSCEIKDEYIGGEVNNINWEAAANSSSVTLLDRFWNENGNYFNYGNDGMDNSFHYWPQAHAMDVIIDAYMRTGDTKYSDLFDKWYVGIKNKNGNRYWNDYYDDMEWITLTMIRLYEATEDTKFLNTAQEMWDEIKTGWNEQAGGGIAWKHTKRWSKNACSNGPASLIAARLYNINHNEEDLEWAICIYNWERETLFIPATGAISDNIDARSGIINTMTLSYNQGTFLGTAHELYKITGEKKYLKDAIRAANFNISDGSMIDIGNNVLRDEGDGDNGLFKGIFIRYFLKLIMEPDLEEGYKRKFVTFFNNNAVKLWQSTNKFDMLFSTNWAVPNSSGRIQLTTQSSACMMIEAKALFEKIKK